MEGQRKMKQINKRKHESKHTQIIKKKIITIKNVKRKKKLNKKT